jgi:predicted dehydrogenase
MTQIRTAVIGTGYLGRFHAEKYVQLDGAHLVAVVDCDAARAAAVAGRLAVPALTDYRALDGAVDAVSVAVPTPLHFPVSEFFLRRGVHVLVEKPMTATIAEADRLIRLARERGSVLQIGHLERCNAAMLAARPHVCRPLFIEAQRIAPFRNRGTDVDVVLDLMIHDIDLILDMVAAPLARIDTVGVPVLSAEADIANARLLFADGCVANLTASRVSNKTERKMRIFESDACIGIDFQNHSACIRRRRGGAIVGEELVHGESDALRMQIGLFIDAIRHGTPPPVSGEEGRRALETALAISARLRVEARAAAPV